MSKKIILSVLASSALLLSACESVSFDSNINPQNFVEYAKPASVTVYTEDSILEHRYHSLGFVSGLACQVDEDDFIARESEARTDARIKTANLGGNAVVFNKCVRLEKTKSCLVSVTCYGEAFVVDDNYKEVNKENIDESQLIPADEESKSLITVPKNETAQTAEQSSDKS